MQKFQCLLFLLKQYRYCIIKITYYYIICMAVPLSMQELLLPPDIKGLNLRLS